MNILATPPPIVLNKTWKKGLLFFWNPGSATCNPTYFAFSINNSQIAIFIRVHNDDKNKI